MTPEEHQLIGGLFDRMRGFTLAEKDAEAEALINTQMGSVRDAAYMLVQSVLVQEQALQQADRRIKELEEQVRALQSAAQPPAGAGSFLGGLFGSRPEGQPQGAPGRGPSVPVVGARATPSVYDSRQSGTQQQPQQGPQQAPQQQAPQGGGFLRSAMATAAGVAGGMLVAGAISSLLTGSNAHAGTSGSQQTPDAGATSASDTSQPQQQESPQIQDAATGSDAREEPSYQEAADSDGGWFGGDGGDFGGDFDI